MSLRQQHQQNFFRNLGGLDVGGITGARILDGSRFPPLQSASIALDRPLLKSGLHHLRALGFARKPLVSMDHAARQPGSLWSRRLPHIDRHQCAQEHLVLASRFIFGGVFRAIGATALQFPQ